MSGNPVIEEMSRRRLKDSLEAHRLLLASAENKARKAQEALIELGMEFCGEQFDALQKSGEDLQLLPPGDLARIIRDHLGLLRMAAGAGDDRDASARQLAQANRELAKLQKEVSEQRKRAEAAERQVRDLQSQAGSLQNTIERLQRELRQKECQPPLHDPIPGGNEETNREAGFTSWLQSYKSDRNFERVAGIIRILGDTGVSRYPELEALVTSGMQISNSTVYWAVKECEAQGLIEKQSDASSLRGRPQHLVILTEKGRWLYQKLTGEHPRESEYIQLLRAHKSSGHLALILRVADLFTRLGYQVVREPLRIQVEENRYFQPDLVARKESETYYLEVERGEQDRASLLQKWENARIAGAGRICVVADKPGTLNRIGSSIRQWATLESKNVTLYQTHLEALKKKKPGESPWTSVKEHGSQ